MKAFIAKTRLFLTADNARVVHAGSPEAAYLFRAAGGAVTELEVDLYGLTDEQVTMVNAKAEMEQAPAETESETATPDVKAFDKPERTKVINNGKKKG